MKKKWTFEHYKNALAGAGPTLKEALLQRAELVDHLPLDKLMELVRLAYPDREVC